MSTQRCMLSFKGGDIKLHCFSNIIDVYDDIIVERDMEVRNNLRDGIGPNDFSFNKEDLQELIKIINNPDEIWSDEHMRILNKDLNSLVDIFRYCTIGGYLSSAGDRLGKEIFLHHFDNEYSAKWMLARHHAKMSTQGFTVVFKDDDLKLHCFSNIIEDDDNNAEWEMESYFMEISTQRMRGGQEDDNNRGRGMEMRNNLEVFDRYVFSYDECERLRVRAIKSLVDIFRYSTVDSGDLLSDDNRPENQIVLHHFDNEDTAQWVLTQHHAKMSSKGFTVVFKGDDLKLHCFFNCLEEYVHINA